MLWSFYFDPYIYDLIGSVVIKKKWQALCHVTVEERGRRVTEPRERWARWERGFVILPFAVGRVLPDPPLRAWSCALCSSSAKGALQGGRLGWLAQGRCRL